MLNKLKAMYYLSEPARSTRFNLANRRLDVASFSHLLSITHVKTLCERLLSLFMLVAATFLLEEPYCNKSRFNKQHMNEHKKDRQIVREIAEPNQMRYGIKGW